MIEKRLEAVNVLIDAKHRPHWLQETCDMAVKEIAHLRQTAAERDRLAQEVERLREVNAALVKQARALLPPNIDKDPDAFSDDWHELAYEVRKAEALAKAEEQS